MLQAQIFIDIEALKGTQSLHDYIIQFLVEHDISGATSFRGYTGFGRNHKIKRPNELFSFDEPPIVITFIDHETKVTAVLRELRKEMKAGLIITHTVEKW